MSKGTEEIKAAASTKKRTPKETKADPALYRRKEKDKDGKPVEKPRRFGR